MRSKSFHRLAMATLIATLLLIMVGGLVRVSGAGLGCPDWPRCWGCWLPPSGPEKIDSNLYDISQFNPTKMWIEYANRMVGVVIGFLILATFLHSIRYFRSSPRLFWASLTAFVLVLFSPDDEVGGAQSCHRGVPQPAWIIAPEISGSGSG